MELYSASEAAARQRTSGPYDAEEIAARLAAAGETLAALPGTGCRPHGLHTMWPTFLADPQVSFPCGADEERCPAPTPAAISAMDEALGWVALIPHDMVRERRIVLTRAQGWSWHRIGAEAGMSHEGARKAHKTAMRRLAATLNRSTPARAA